MKKIVVSAVLAGAMLMMSGCTDNRSPAEKEMDNLKKDMEYLKKNM